MKRIISFLFFLIGTSFALSISAGNTRTYYRFAQAMNGFCSPGANERLSVTFNDDGSITADNRLWTYSNSVGIIRQKGWVNGQDYITASNDLSELTFNHQELVVGNIYFVTHFIVFTDKESTAEVRLAYCNFLNSGTNNNMSSGSFGGRNNRPQSSNGRRCTKTSVSDTYHCGGNGRCAKCFGKGTYTDYSYGKRNSYICPNCNGSKMCPACNGTGYR